MSTFAVATLGCKVNQYETEQLIKNFSSEGFALVDFSKRADTYIINTCTVTSQADRKSRQLIKRARRRNPHALVIATGCSVENPKSQVSQLKEIDRVVSNKKKIELAPSVFFRNNRKTQRVDLRRASKQILHTRALVKIQDGCNQFCSYCIVPYTRGLPRSRNRKEIISEIEGLLKSGSQEIVLTGIHLGLYKDGGHNFEDFLREIIAMPKLRRVHLSSLQVKEITPDLISLISSSKKICRHLHIPLQSGSDRILQAMNRNYGTSEYMQVTERLKQRIPDLALTTDIIVGFPEEEESDFEKTISLVKKISFRKIHVFRFSPRRGTAAACFPHQIPTKIKKQRSEQLIKVGDFLAKNFLRTYLGKRLEVLVERKKGGGYLTGLTNNYIRVDFPGPSSKIGKITRVKVVDFSNSSELDENLSLLGEG